MRITNLIANKSYDYRWWSILLTVLLTLLHQYFLVKNEAYLLVQIPLFLGLAVCIFILSTIVKPVHAFFSAVRNKDYRYAVRLLILIILFSIVSGHLMIREERTGLKVFPFLSWLPSNQQQ